MTARSDITSDKIKSMATTDLHKKSYGAIFSSSIEHADNEDDAKVVDGN